MMPTPTEQKHIEEKAELIKDMEKLKIAVICVAAIAFGSGLLFGCFYAVWNAATACAVIAP